MVAGGSNLTSISVGLHDEVHEVVIDPYFLPSQVSYGLNTNIPGWGGPPVDWEVVTFVQPSPSFLLRGKKNTTRGELARIEHPIQVIRLTLLYLLECVNKNFTLN